MDITIFCLATLSKKLEKICKNGPLFLTIQSLENNKGVGRLKISCPDNTSLDSIKDIGSTNIQLKIDSVSEDVQDMKDSEPVGNLYIPTSNVPNHDENGKVQKTAITNPDAEVKNYKNAESYSIQKQVKKAQSKISVGKFVADYDDLVKIISSIKNIDADIPIPKTNQRMNRAEAIEYGKLMQVVPKLPFGVFISNETKSRLCIDDLNLQLAVNEISDISSIPAKIIFNSRQLRISCEKGYIKFRSRGEYDEWCKKQADDISDEIVGLQVFDKPEEAEEALGSDGEKKKNTLSSFTDKKNIVKKSSTPLLIKDSDIEGEETTVENADKLTEEERMLEDIANTLSSEKNKEENESRPKLLSDEIQNDERKKIKRL